MIVLIHSKKYGTQEVIVDPEDYELAISLNLHLWTSPRHYGLYVMHLGPKPDYKEARFHRTIMNAKPGEIVDHINRNPLDNRKCNLRITNSFVNNQNARKRKDGVTSRFKGVSWNRARKMWVAQIQINKKKKGLGYFLQEEDAAKAYDAALEAYNLAGPRNFPIKSES